MKVTLPPLFYVSFRSGDPNICSISNPNFVIYSSVVSFYLPFLVTLLLYIRIYMVLRQRQRKRILSRQSSHSGKTCYKQQVWPTNKKALFRKGLNCHILYSMACRVLLEPRRGEIETALSIATGLCRPHFYTSCASSSYGVCSAPINYCSSCFLAAVVKTTAPTWWYHMGCFWPSAMHSLCLTSCPTCGLSIGLWQDTSRPLVRPRITLFMF